MRIHSSLRHTPHCSLGCACTGETAPGSSVTTESIACTPGNTRAFTPGASCRSMPPVFRLWKHETSVISSLLSRRGDSRCLAPSEPLHYAPLFHRSSRPRRRFRGESPMPSPAFYATDFKVFDEQGFRARMGAIRERIRPKLEAVGHSLTPAVSRATGGDAYAHVAKHARRTVNPPEDTWVAFGPDARGYKKHCHFKVAVSRRAVRFLFEVGPEHADKKRWAAAWKRNAPRLAPVLRRVKGLAWFKNEHDDEAAAPLADLERGEARRLANLKREHYTRLARRGAVAVAGAGAFVEALARAGVPRAVATSATRRDLERVLDALGLRRHIDLAITADDVRRGKPHPEVYLKAAEGLGVESRACLVFEDAIVGVQAARAAGMRVIGVTTAHTADELVGAGAERAVPHFEAVRWPV